MSPVATLFAALLFLHVVEGLLWVRRSASAFVRTWRRYRPLGTRTPLGNTDHTILLLSPHPPYSEIFVTEPWPLVFGADAVRLIEVERAPGAKAITPGSAAYAETVVAQARAEGKEVQTADTRLWASSSPIAAPAVAELLRRWATAAPAERSKVVDEALAARFDREGVRARLAEVERAGRLLRVLAHVASLALFAGMYLFFFVPAGAVAWPVIVGTMVLALLATWIELYRVHKRVYPAAKGDRAMKLLLVVLSFPAAARARAWVARDALALYHPVVVAEALLDREAFERWVAPRWRDLRFPVGPDPDDARTEIAAARAALIAAYRRVFAAIELDPQTLEALPTGAVATCPRCRAELTRAEGDCPDCPGVKLVPGSAATRAA